MTNPRPARLSAESDAFGRGRRTYCYLQRAGATAWIKRNYRRGERRDAKREIRREDG